MNTLLEFITAGWLDRAAAVLGIVIAVVIHFRTRTINRLAVQVDGIGLIGGQAALPADVQVAHRGVIVPRLTKSVVLFWNAGTTTLRGSDIVEADPLRIELSHESAGVLDVRVTRATRIVNGVRAGVDTDNQSAVLVGFDFLDPGDGARIELLHTSSWEPVYPCGTLRGLPKGITHLGRLPIDDSDGPSPNAGKVERTLWRLTRKARRTTQGILALFGGVITGVGLFPGVVVAFFPSLGVSVAQPTIDPANVNWAIVAAGITMTLTTFYPWWRRRRKYPRKLYEPIRRYPEDRQRLNSGDPAQTT